MGSVGTFPTMRYAGRRWGLGVAGAVYAVGAVLQVSFPPMEGGEMMTDGLCLLKDVFVW